MFLVNSRIPLSLLLNKEAYTLFISRQTTSVFLAELMLCPKPYLMYCCGFCRNLKFIIMQIFKNDRFSSLDVVLLVFGLVAIIILISSTYEMATVFVDAFHDKVDTVNSDIMESVVVNN